MSQSSGNGLYYIGLMSGTSLDGIDACLVQFNEQHLNLVETHYQSYPTQLNQVIQKACSGEQDDLHTLASLDIQLAGEYASAVEQLLNKTSLSSADITAIGSHGQTIRHCPECDPPYTLQLGNAHKLAALTNITTVADFRQQDIVAGGQGAPLAPAFHQYLFGQSNQTVIGLNLGGIANISVLHANGNVTGHDTGPANTLMNQWIQHHKGPTYDDNGNWARSGELNQKLLRSLMNEPWLKLPPPKSTGPELFNLSWLDQHIGDSVIKPEDVQHTLCEYSALTIADHIHRYADDAKLLITCGGGAHNSYLIERLQAALPKTEIQTSEAYSIAPDWIESAMMAWLAHQTLQGLPGNIPSVTGAKEARVLGAIHPKT